MTKSPIRVEYSLTNFGKEAFSLLIPFLIYHILPPSFKKDFPKITHLEESIEKMVRTEYNQEIEI